ncbi:hypothetical protein B0H14DRAFT_3672968 [Mycena olivaceomarginata]|nr:hypothetical protein B0H14DRAFT_3672968 [Mycena olivaceomarginata]
MYFTYYNIPPNPVQTAFTGSLKRLHVLKAKQDDRNARIRPGIPPTKLGGGGLKPTRRRPFSWTIGAAIMDKRQKPRIRAMYHPISHGTACQQPGVPRKTPSSARPTIREPQGGAPPERTSTKDADTVPTRRTSFGASCELRVEPPAGTDAEKPNMRSNSTRRPSAPATVRGVLMSPSTSEEGVGEKMADVVESRRSRSSKGCEMRVVEREDDGLGDQSGNAAAELLSGNGAAEMPERCPDAFQSLAIRPVIEELEAMDSNWPQNHSAVELAQGVNLMRVDLVPLLSTSFGPSSSPIPNPGQVSAAKTHKIIMEKCCNDAMQKLKNGCVVCWARGFHNWNTHFYNNCKEPCVHDSDDGWNAFKNAFEMGGGWC